MPRLCVLAILLAGAVPSPALAQEKGGPICATCPTIEQQQQPPSADLQQSRLQRYMQRRSQAIQFQSNVVKKKSDTSKSAIQNMK